MQISKLFLPEVEEAISQGDVSSLRAVFEHLHPSDIAELLAELSPDSIARVVRILRAPRGIEVFEHLEVSVQEQVLAHLGRVEAINILEEMSADDRVDLFKRLPQGKVDSFLPLMAQAERDEVRKLIQYGENTAGALMTTEYAAVSADLTVEDALRHLRTIAPDSETIYYVYIIDPERHLLGVATLRQILVARSSQKMKEVMAADIVRMSVDSDQEEVAKAFAKYDLIAIPVVDTESRLVGIVTHDDAMDVVVEEQTEDAHMMGAVEPVENPYLHAGFWELVKKRATWLVFLFVGGFFTTSALQYFEGTINKALALMFFLPLVISSGGNTGSQSVTLITRALAVGDVRLRDYLRVVQREGGTGITLGLFLGTVGYIVVRIFGFPADLALSVAIALIGVVTAGSLIGALLPLLFKKLGFDPAIMSSPFVSSLVDVIGIVIYFLIAQAFLK